MSDLIKLHGNFLESVKKYISEYPEVAPFVTDFLRRGIEDALQDTRERAADMECALLMQCTNAKQERKFISDKILKWKDKGSFNWKAWESVLNKWGGR